MEPVQRHPNTDSTLVNSPLVPAPQLMQGIIDAVQGYVAYCEPVREEVSLTSSAAVTDFTYQVINARMSDLIGQPADQLIGRRMTEFASPVWTDGLLLRYVAALETGQATTFDSLFQINGTDHWYLITARPLASGLVISLLDITDRKRAELRAHQQTAEIRATLNASLNSILRMRAIRDERGTIVDFLMEAANQAVVHSLFREPAELIGQRLLTLYPGNIESGFFALYAHVADTGESGRAEYRYQDVNGFTGWFDVSAVQQEPDLIVLTFNNVTAQREAQQAQQRQAQVLQAIIDHSRTAISLHEAIRDEQHRIVDFQVVQANQQARLNWGELTNEMLSKSFLTLRPDARNTEEFKRYVRVVETGQSESFEFTHDSRQYAITIANADSSIVMSAVDVTIDRQYRRELERMNRVLRQSNENLQQFAHVASHDLQEPLRKIQAFSDILQNQFEDNLSEGERDMTRRIQKSAGRMQQLIKDLLAYSQVADRREPYEPVSINQVADDVISDLEVVISETKATVQVGTLPTVMGIASRLRQLIQNLLANALKFRHPERTPFIQIDARPARPDELPAGLTPVNYWAIRVADNGLGFNEKYKDIIFQPFQRVHDRDAYSGTGIGLAICQRVVEGHGGAIDVHSRPGEGTTFTVYLMQDEQ